MRNSFSRQSRYMTRRAAISQSALSLARTTLSWLPQAAVVCVAVDPRHWLHHARQENYWRMVEICNDNRTLY